MRMDSMSANVKYEYIRKSAPAQRFLFVERGVVVERGLFFHTGYLWFCPGNSFYSSPF